ncbi:MAG: hypothetical protein NTY19_03040 [Planctomycetota bacterium]|nr:hypothetical protein [Planctomycetota bacterium]
MFTALDRRQGGAEFQRSQLPPGFITYCFGGVEHGKLPWVPKTQCLDEHGRWARGFSSGVLSRWMKKNESVV